MVSISLQLQMSIQAAFLTARSLLSMAFGTGEAVQQGMHVLFTPRVM